MFGWFKSLKLASPLPAAFCHPRHGDPAACRADPCGKDGELRGNVEGQRGRGSDFPLLPVHIGGNRHRAHRVRQVCPGLLQAGPQRSSDSFEVRRVRSPLRHVGLLHEQGRASGRLWLRLHHPGVPQESAAAVQWHDGAKVPVCYEIQRFGAGWQRPGSVCGCNHLLRRWECGCLSK